MIEFQHLHLLRSCTLFLAIFEQLVHMNYQSGSIVIPMLLQPSRKEIKKQMNSATRYEMKDRFITTSGPSIKYRDIDHAYPPSNYDRNI